MTLLDELTAQPAPIRMDADGVFRVGQTRVRLDTVIVAFNSGDGAEEILLKYPSLSLTDIYAVITYYLWYRSEVDEYLLARQQQIAESDREIQAKFPRDGVRERLLARRPGTAS